MSKSSHGERMLKRCKKKKWERTFVEALLKRHPEVGEGLLILGAGYVAQQHRASGYLIDFALIGERAKFAVEIDENHHSHWWSRERDDVRDMTLTADGWRIVRISESQLAEDAAKCVADLIRVVQATNASATQIVVQAKHCLRRGLGFRCGGPTVDQNGRWTTGARCSCVCLDCVALREHAIALSDAYHERLPKEAPSLRLDDEEGFRLHGAKPLPQGLFNTHWMIDIVSAEEERWWPESSETSTSQFGHQLQHYPPCRCDACLVNGSRRERKGSCE